MIKVIAAATLATVLLAGCDTIKGAGQDVSSGGHVISNAAQSTQDKM